MQHRSTSLMAQAETDSNSSSTKELCHLRSESEDPFIFKYNFGTWRAPGKSFTVELYQKEHLFYPQTIRDYQMEVLMLAAETGKPIGELMAMKVEDMLKFQAKFTVNPLQRKTQPELKLSQSDLAMSAWKHEPDHAARLRLKKDGFGCPRTRKEYIALVKIRSEQTGISAKDLLTVRVEDLVRLDKSGRIRSKFDLRGIFLGIGQWDENVAEYYRTYGNKKNYPLTLKEYHRLLKVKSAETTIPAEYLSTINIFDLLSMNRAGYVVKKVEKLNPKKRGRPTENIVLECVGEISFENFNDGISRQAKRRKIESKESSLTAEDMTKTTKAISDEKDD